MCVLIFAVYLHLSVCSLSSGHGDHLFLPTDWSCRIRTSRSELPLLNTLSVILKPWNFDLFICFNLPRSILIILIQKHSSVCACLLQGSTWWRGSSKMELLSAWLWLLFGTEMLTSSKVQYLMNSFLVICHPLEPGAITHSNTALASLYYLCAITTCTRLCAFYRPCDVIVEVCHPQITREFGLLFLSQSHFMVRLFFFFDRRRFYFEVIFYY